MKAQHFSEDIQEFLRLLQLHAVRYLLVGGEAVIYYGYARLTGDVDFFYERTENNCGRLFDALKEFWGGTVPEVSESSELMRPGLVLQYGRPPNRIDLINTITGVEFSAAWDGRVEERIQIPGESIIVLIIGLDALILNKEGANRDKDRDDLRFLKRRSPPSQE